MKITSKKLLFIAVIVSAVLLQPSFAEPPATSSSLKTLASMLEGVHQDIAAHTKAAGDAERELSKLKTSSPPDQDKIAAQQKILDNERQQVGGAQQRLEALTNASAALHNQDPIQKTIGELKDSLNDFPANGTDTQKEQRNIILGQIKKLEQSGHSLDSSAGWLFFILIIALIVVAFAPIFILLWKNYQGDANGNSANNNGGARDRLAFYMTSGPMSFIVLISAVTLFFAGYNAWIGRNGTKDTELFFDVAKWVLATVLPVVAAWVGGVMAYYFGKDNFKAGAENVEKLAKEFNLTPQQKLANRKAGEFGLEIGKATTFSLLNNNELNDIPLADIKNKITDIHQRMPILDKEGCVKACLHMSTLTKFAEAEKKELSNTKLGELIKGLPWEPSRSFSTVSPSENLARVQDLLKAQKECQDVFVTTNGTKDSPVLRWITNDDIMRAADS